MSGNWSMAIRIAMASSGIAKGATVEASTSSVPRGTRGTLLPVRAIISTSSTSFGQSKGTP